ncbi:signal peptidase I [Bifidobacterium oedipodis]|uniref:Signal peptidase I n=1 Tax=Bifidobacterium oedipodis TaxID=2675322 RepID=A0A7Y0HU11_9BIFI|nr:signal peptidase I [Bifidobacterium sp. DSM 109957]NMM95163.1 signal peptidase [Bifidobacterium sp. DSM 109957]
MQDDNGRIPMSSPNHGTSPMQPSAQRSDALEDGMENSEAAREARNFQVADHGVDPTPVPFTVEASATSAGDNMSAQPQSTRTRSRAAHKASRTSDDRFTLRDFFLWCGIPVVIVLLIRIFLLGFYEIPSRSMQDTILPGDRVIASKLTPGVFDLQRGDIVVFKDPNGWLADEQSDSMLGSYLIKRLIGLPGDTVACEGAGQPVTVNGVAIDESSYIRPGVDPSAIAFSVTVTEGHVFVMGDNRANSADSRYHLEDADHGLVPISDVAGTAFVTYWPLGRIGALESHHEVFDQVPDAKTGDA